MKKLFLLLLLCCPILLTAQEKAISNTPQFLKPEIAVSPVVLLRLIGVEPQRQPVFLELKYLVGKRHLRLRVESYTESVRNSQFGNAFIKDSLLIVDNTVTTQGGAFLRIGVERQRLFGINSKCRLRSGIDALVGTQRVSKIGSYATLDVKKNVLITKDYSTKDFESQNYFTAGLAAFVGVDYLIGKRTYLGLNVDMNLLYAPQKPTNTSLAMKISPYLAWKF